MLSATISRETSEAFIPSVPIAMPSEMAIVLHSTGVPPASRIPSFTQRATSRRWTVQGMISIQLWATPTSGRPKSASVYPAPRIIARAGARDGPSSIVRLWVRGASVTRARMMRAPGSPRRRSRGARASCGSDPRGKVGIVAAIGADADRHEREVAQLVGNEAVAPHEPLGVRELVLFEAEVARVQPVAEVVERLHPGHLAPGRGRLWLADRHAVELPARQPRHHPAQGPADPLDLRVALARPDAQQLGRAAAALGDPALGEAAVADLAEDRAHGLADVSVDDPRARHVIAVLSGIAHRVAHVAEPALVHEVDDQLHLVHALEICDLRLIPGLDERLEPGLDELGDPTAEHRLLAEQVGLDLLREGRLDDPGARGADRAGVREASALGVTARVLGDGQEGGDAAALDEDLAHPVPRGLRRDQDHVDLRPGNDLAEVDRERVRDDERASGLHVRRHLFEDRTVVLVRHEQNGDVGLARGVGDGPDGEPVALGRGPAAAPLGEAHDHVAAAVAEVLRVRVTLAAVADDRDALPGELPGIRVRFVVDGRHVYL